MFFSLRKLLYAFSFNTCLFLLLIIGIQNSTNRSKVNLLTIETVRLPVSFIIGLSFISGSISANFVPINFKNKQD